MDFKNKKDQIYYKIILFNNLIKEEILINSDNDDIIHC